MLDQNEIDSLLSAVAPEPEPEKKGAGPQIFTHSGVDAEHVEVGEHQAAIEKKDLAFHLDTRAVPANFAKTPEECHRNWRSLRVANLWGLL